MMARPREFDTIEALDLAVELFSAKGYHATSLHGLLGAMRVSKSSFYDTFGSKHDLYVMSLGRYIEHVVPTVVAKLKGEGSGRAAIVGTFADLVRQLVDPEGWRGCFLVSSAVDMAPHDEQVARQVRAGQDQIEAAFNDAVCRAQEAGEISPARDTRTLARFLAATRHGLIVTAKTRPPRTALEAVVQQALTTLD